MNSLPNSVNYSTPIPSLPDNATKYSVALQPVNGSSFLAGGQQIIFQFANRGFLIPDSVYLRYKCAIVNGATASAMLGTPVYTPFQRLETQFGSVTVDSINNYNQVANVLVNTTMDIAQKYGQQSAYGWGTSDNTAVPSIEQFDGRYTNAAGTDTFYVSAPLPCLMTNCDKLLPLFAMPTISLILTTDALNNMFLNTTSIASITLSNVELCYDFIDMGSEIEAVCRGMGPTIYIKSQSFSQSAVSIPVNSNGSQSIVFNQRYASVKAAFVTFSSAVNNKAYDAVDITNNSGNYSLTVSGVQYPQKYLDAANNKAGILQELRRCVGSLYDTGNSMSINMLEWGQIDTVANVNNYVPGKFILGFNLEKLHTNALLTGISTNNSNLCVNINQSVQTSFVHQCNLILGFDALIEIDMVNRQASIKV